MRPPPRSALGSVRLWLVLGVFTAALSATRADDFTPEERQRGFRARALLAKPRADLATVERAEASASLRLVRTHPRLGGIRHLETDGSEEIKAVAERLRATGLYDYVEPDYIRRATILPDDTRFASDQWSLNNTGQDGGTPGADIKAPAAWDIIREAPDVIVAVIDSGVLLQHEDIAANLWVNTVERNATTISVDDDGNGYVDDINGINATVARTSAAASNPNDTNGHGSHVAGIIGAVGGNGKGVSGIAWKTRVMPLKFLNNSGTGAVSASIACIDYAIAKGAHIINGSYGSETFSQAEFDALRRARDAGIIFVAAAGNDSQEISSLPQYPAAYALDNIVAVAATTRQDRLASYSTYGSGLVDLAAPGSSILSLGITSVSSYAVLSGTSMAAPHVAGALALLKQRFPADNHRALINRLLSTVDELPALNHAVHTNGRLNLARALASTDTRPFNDDFARRATITGETNTVRASNQFATVETAESNHGTAGTTGSLWWTWTAPMTAGKLLLTTAGSAIDTVAAIYTGSTLATLQRVAANDDTSATVNTSTVTFDYVPGTTYTIAITGKNNATGLIVYRLGVVAANDSFAQARVLTGPSAVAAGNNANATRETGEPLIVAGARGRTLWYRWTAPASRRYQISTYSYVDPIVGVFTGTGFANLVLAASNNDGGPYTDSLVTLSATAGVTYHIAVDLAAGEGGAFTLSIADSEWQYVTDDPLYSAPAVAPDGTIYFGDNFGYIHAVNPNGTRRWRYTGTVGYMDAGAIAVAPDGTIYAADDTGLVYALNPTGTQKWRLQLPQAVWAAPAIAPDGTIYVKCDDGQLYALNPDGTQKSKIAIPGDTYTAPTIAADGTIYIASEDNHLYALNPDGTQRWRFNLGATTYASPALGADGTIYLGNFEGVFFALRPNGTERWRFDTGATLSGSAAIDARGVVYFGSYNRKVYALNGATGAKLWEFATGDIIRGTCPVIADDGAIYIGSDDGFVYALEPDGSLRRTYATSATIYAAPVIAAGRLYVPSGDAKLYAFQIGANLGNTPWPMHRHNLRRLGRSETLAGIPAIATQPSAPAAAVTSGAAVSLSVGATVAGGALSYQWYFNQVAVAGATAATLTFSSAQTSNAGTYQVVITGPGGSIISRTTDLAVTAGATDAARLINLAVRTNAGSGANVLFVGFVTGGAGTAGSKPLLIRGVGPTLGAFGVTGALADPRLQVFSGTNLIQENDDWAGDAAIATLTPQLGAFALSGATSRDAAVLFNRDAGTYTAQISGAGTAAGVALAEIYDATPAANFTSATPRLINVSARTQVGTGANILIAGFVIAGTSSKSVLIRGIGPTLGVFGVTGVLANPRLDIYPSNSTTPISSNDDWGTAANAAQVAATSAAVGAFALALESRDAVLLVTLPPGSYTAQVSGVNNTSGVALVEVYEVP